MDTTQLFKFSILHLRNSCEERMKGGTE